MGTADEVHVSEEINTRKGVARILEAAFMWANERGRNRVTMSDKSNAIPFQRIWGQLFKEIGARYPGVEQEHRYVDALALELVREPERFQVIVTTNLYGDILSDLGAGLVGGLGIAASANLHPGRPGLYEPVHGSAPGLVGRQTGESDRDGADRCPDAGAARLRGGRLPPGAGCVSRRRGGTTHA